MRVGIDARMLCRSVTGIERYALEIIRRLLCLYPDVEFFLYAPLPIKAQFSGAPNLTVRTADVKLGSVGTLLWAQTKLPFWANKDELDVFWGPAHRLPRLLSAKIARVVTIHDLVWKYAGETMRPAYRVIESTLMPDAVRLADRVVADSQSTAEAIVIEFPLAKMKTQVVYLGAAELPPPRASDVLLDLEIDRPYMLFVGTLEPRKNLRRLLQAYATLDSSIKAKYLLVIAGGKGWGNQDMVTLIRELRIENSVRLTGYVNDEMLATLYQHALFLAMPSLYEGFGLPLLEAMSFGVPVLTSLCSSMPEVAGDAGLLIEPLNIDSIAQGVSKLLTDDGYRNSLAVRAKSSATRFGWEKAANEIMEVFKQAVLARQARGE
jgi:glycosyltransferase involved in cell wall biosynthesis